MFQSAADRVDPALCAHQGDVLRSCGLRSMRSIADEDERVFSPQESGSTITSLRQTKETAADDADTKTF